MNHAFKQWDGNHTKSFPSRRGRERGGGRIYRNKCKRIEGVILETTTNQALRKWEENNASIISYHVAEGEGKGGGRIHRNKCKRIKGVIFETTMKQALRQKGGGGGRIHRNKIQQNRRSQIRNHHDYQTFREGGNINEWISIQILYRKGRI